MKSGWKVALVVLFLAVLGAAIYFSFFFSYKCADDACFASHREKCARTVYVKEGEDTVNKYRILGMADGLCEIEVEILEIKTGTVDKRKLEGKSMVCSATTAGNEAPESDLSQCSGLLKESIQEIMIQNAHAQIIANLGEIGEEFGKVL